MPQKFGPVKERKGTALYPGFGSTVPANAGRLQRIETGSTRTQRGQIRPTAGNYTRLPINTLVQSGSQTNQKLNLANSNVHKIGSTPPNSLSGNFAYVAPAAGTSITWYWDGTNGSLPIVIHRSDNSNFTIPGGSLTVTGLSVSTTYYFIPFWNTSCRQLGWVKGTHGNPLIAFLVAAINGPQGNFYVMQSNLQNLEPLTAGFMTADTGSGSVGGGGSAGGGGAGGRCVMEGTEIETLGDFPYTIIEHLEIDWIHLVVKDGRSLHCTVDHILYHAERGKVQAQTLIEGDYVITSDGEQEVIYSQFVTKRCKKYEIKMEEGHLYWANGFLSHNVKVGGLI